MDYGKTAYLKVSELEARLADRLTAKPKNRTAIVMKYAAKSERVAE